MKETDGVGSRLAEVYRLILGDEIMNILARVRETDKDLAIEMMRVLVQGWFGTLPSEQVTHEIDRLLTEYQRRHELQP